MAVSEVVDDFIALDPTGHLSSLCHQIEFHLVEMFVPWLSWQHALLVSFYLSGSFFGCFVDTSSFAYFFNVGIPWELCPGSSSVHTLPLSTISTWDCQIHNPRPGISAELQLHISKYLLDISTERSSTQFKLNMSKMGHTSLLPIPALPYMIPITVSDSFIYPLLPTRS